MVPPTPDWEPIKFMLVGPGGELHEARARLPHLDNLQAGDEVEAEDTAFGFKLFFVITCIDRPIPTDPRFSQARTWVYLELAR